MPSSKQKLELVNRWLSRWKPRLLLDKWAVMSKLAEKDPPARGGLMDMAYITVDTTNSEAWLEVCPRLWNESREYQEASTVHELAHIHTEPVRKLLDKAIRAGAIDKAEAKDQLEDLTNSIAKIVWAAHKRRPKKTEYHL